MHQGIGENRNMINADREAASTTRVEVSRLQRDVSEINECMEFNNSAINERFMYWNKIVQPKPLHSQHSPKP
jgi:hypothetical protein